MSLRVCCLGSSRFRPIARADRKKRRPVLPQSLQTASVALASAIRTRRPSSFTSGAYSFSKSTASGSVMCSNTCAARIEYLGDASGHVDQAFSEFAMQGGSGASVAFSLFARNADSTSSNHFLSGLFFHSLSGHSIGLATVRRPTAPTN
jgi:hypothetical protein